MRRAVLIAAAATLLGGGCARGEVAPRAATRLAHQVSSIRRAAEAGAPQVALGRVETLTATVNVLLDQGKIDRGRALAILSAAEDVRTQLALLPARSSSTETLSPSPAESNNGNHGEDNNGNGNGGDED